jgi:hypothetical protein
MTGFDSKRQMAMDKVVQPAQEQWLQDVSIKIEAALLSHRLSLHRDSDDAGNGFPLIDALCCGQTSLDFGRREVEDIVEAIYHVLDANIPTAAQPEQEPVAWGFRHHDGAIYDCISPEEHADCEGEYNVPLYDTPPKRPWVGLTDEEIEQMGLSNYIKVVRETEAKLKEKNFD